MNETLVGFSAFLSDTKKCSKNTLEAYMRDISQFIDYCELNGTATLKSIDEKYIHSYLEYLSITGKSDSTKTRIIASLRCYFKYLCSSGSIKKNPTASVKNPRTAKKMPGILDSKEIIQLLSAPGGKDYKSLRDKAMLELLYATGIRVSELIDLKITDINLQIGILHAHNGRQDRIIPIYPAAVKHIGEYLSVARPAIVQDDDQNLLFTNMSGQALSRQGFWKIIKQYADRAGIRAEITPHTLRHSFAAHLLENGAQLKDIKEMLGHADISSTQIYAQIVKSKYIQSYAKFHPLAK